MAARVAAKAVARVVARAEANRMTTMTGKLTVFLFSKLTVEESRSAIQKNRRW